MSSRDNRWTISYNGEVYNTNLVRDRFGLAKFEFRGHSDTEVLIEAIAVAGVEAVVRELDAMFAFAAWDSVEERLWLARDRFGEKPLYFSASQDRVMFASEPRALLPLFDTSPQIDAAGLSDLVRYGQVTGSHSIYTGCRRVRPGQIVSFGRDPHDDREVRYWTPVQAARTAKSSPRALAADEVERVLAKSVERRMVSDVPLGAFLSGGVDSSLVVALMQKHSDRPVKTFTIGFGDRQYNEAGWAARGGRTPRNRSHRVDHVGRRRARCDPATTSHLRRTIRRLFTDPYLPGEPPGASTRDRCALG